MCAAKESSCRASPHSPGVYDASTRFSPRSCELDLLSPSNIDGNDEHDPERRTPKRRDGDVSMPDKWIHLIGPS